MHSMQFIAETGSRPMVKAPIRLESRDDRLTGTMLAAEVMAYAKGGRSQWRAFAIRIIDMTVEARTVFLNTIKADKASMTKAQKEAGFGEKFAKFNTNSLSVEVSKLQTIANAFNSGGSVEGWRDYVNQNLDDKSKHAQTDKEMLEHAGYDTLVAYARTFSQSKAGRKADTLAVKLAKFLKNNAPSQDADATEQRLYETLVEISNKANEV
jgi:hypothetical protein